MVGHRVQVIVPPALRQQIAVRATLDDLAVIHNYDQIAHGDRAQAMGDDEARSPGQQPPDGFLDQLLRMRVDVARRLVQDQDARIGHQRPCKGQQLPLPDR